MNVIVREWLSEAEADESEMFVREVEEDLLGILEDGHHEELRQKVEYIHGNCDVVVFVGAPLVRLYE